MNYNTYFNKLLALGFETGRGNKNAFNEVFGDKKEKLDHDCKREDCNVCPSKI